MHCLNDESIRVWIIQFVIFNFITINLSLPPNLTWLLISTILVLSQMLDTQYFFLKILTPTFFNLCVEKWYFIVLNVTPSNSFIVFTYYIGFLLFFLVQKDMLDYDVKGKNFILLAKFTQNFEHGILLGPHRYNWNSLLTTQQTSMISWNPSYRQREGFY